MLSGETISIIIFFIVLGIIIYLNRKKVVTQKILFPVLYILMLRTKIGIKLMDKIAKKAGRQLKYIGYIGVVVGFIGMIVISFFLMQGIYKALTKTEHAPSLGLVGPFKIKGFFYVPFFYWIISLFVLAAVHEFAHGVFTRIYNVRVKSSGFAFLGIIIPVIPAAYVEPDEKTLAKKSAWKQLSVYSAGPFSNIIMTFLLLLIFNFLLVPSYMALNERNGIPITEIQENSAFKGTGVSKGDIIHGFDNKEIVTFSNLSIQIEKYKPGDKVRVSTDKGKYNIVLKENPKNSSVPYMGISLEQSTKVKDNYAKYASLNPVLIWFTGNWYKLGIYENTGLIGWLIILNFGIGLFNLVPLGPIDGGRMLKVVLDKFFKEKDNANRIFNSVGIFFLIVIIFLIATSILR